MQFPAGPFLFINGKLLERRSFSLPQIKLMNWLVPVMRTLDPSLSIPPLSLIAILRPAAGRSAAAEATTGDDPGPVGAPSAGPHRNGRN